MKEERYLLEITRPGESRIHWFSSFAMRSRAEYLREMESRGSVFLSADHPATRRRIKNSPGWTPGPLDSWGHQIHKDKPGDETAPFTSKIPPGWPNPANLQPCDREILRSVTDGNADPAATFVDSSGFLRRKLRLRNLAEVLPELVRRKAAWDVLRLAHLEALESMGKDFR